EPWIRSHRFPTSIVPGLSGLHSGRVANSAELPSAKGTATGSGAETDHSTAPAANTAEMDVTVAATLLLRSFLLLVSAPIKAAPSSLANALHEGHLSSGVEAKARCITASTDCPNPVAGGRSP